MEKELLDITPLFIQRCKEAGYLTIQIGGQYGIEVTYEGKDGPRIDNWPALWAITEEFDLSWGCGSSRYQQYKVPNGFTLVPGTYN